MAKKQPAPPTLLAGPYKPPQPLPGRQLDCLVRGKLPVEGFTTAPIPWPFTRYRGPERPRSGKPILIVTPELARAVRTESVTAICHYWRVVPSTVYLWRQALNVGRITAGTRQLLTRHAHAKLTKVARKLPAIRAAIAAGKTNQQIEHDLGVPWRSVWRIRTGITFSGSQPPEK